MKTVYLRNFDPDLYKEMKLQAVREEITLKKLIEKAVSEYLKKKKDGEDYGVHQ